jgi:hypothetical protein
MEVAKLAASAEHRRPEMKVGLSAASRDGIDQGVGRGMVHRRHDPSPSAAGDGVCEADG